MCDGFPGSYLSLWRDGSATSPDKLWTPLPTSGVLPAQSPWQSCYWLGTLSSRPQSCCSYSVNIAFHSLCARHACCNNQPAPLPCEALGLTWAKSLSKPVLTTCEIANRKRCCYEGNTKSYKVSYRQEPCFLWEMSVWVCVLGTWTNNGLRTQKMGQNCKIE